jgi:hypothetical protein
MMFETIRDLTLIQVDAVVQALYDEEPAAVRADPSGAYIVLRATPELPYELDFVCVSSIETMAPQPMTRDDRDRLLAWAKRAVPTICRRWKKQYPDHPHAPAN